MWATGADWRTNAGRSGVRVGGRAGGRAGASTRWRASHWQINAYYNGFRETEGPTRRTDRGHFALPLPPLQTLPRRTDKRAGEAVRSAEREGHFYATRRPSHQIHRIGVKLQDLSISRPPPTRPPPLPFHPPARPSDHPSVYPKPTRKPPHPAARPHVRPPVKLPTRPPARPPGRPTARPSAPPPARPFVRVLARPSDHSAVRSSTIQPGSPLFRNSARPPTTRSAHPPIRESGDIIIWRCKQPHLAAARRTSDDVIRSGWPTAR